MEEKRKCPFCNEEISEESQECPSCHNVVGEDMNNEEPKPAETKEEKAPVSEATKPKDPQTIDTKVSIDRQAHTHVASTFVSHSHPVYQEEEEYQYTISGYILWLLLLVGMGSLALSYFVENDANIGYCGFIAVLTVFVLLSRKKMLMDDDDKGIPLLFFAGALVIDLAYNISRDLFEPNFVFDTNEIIGLYRPDFYEALIVGIPGLWAAYKYGLTPYASKIGLYTLAGVGIFVFTLYTHSLLSDYSFHAGAGFIKLIGLLYIVCPYMLLQAFVGYLSGDSSVEEDEEE